MKKIMPFFAVMLFLLPFNNALAYEGGLLNSKVADIYRGSSNTKIDTTGIVTDGDLTNEYRMVYNTSNILEFTLDKPTDIDSYQLKMNNKKNINNINGYMAIEFTKEDGTTTRVNSLNIDGIKTSFPVVEDVVKVRCLLNAYEIWINEFDVYEKKYAVDPVANLTAEKTSNSINLSWENPKGLSNVIVKSNGEEKAVLPGDKNAYTLTGLKPETLYNIEVFAKYSNGEISEPKSIKVTTDAPPKPVGDVESLSAKATHERVDLSWTLPDSEKLKHVIIYRDTLQKSFFDKMFGVSTVKAATPIFETNGTYFNDLTVEPETKYEYTVTTFSTEQIESDGVSVTVTTLKEPEPEIEGGGYEKDSETGDYTYTWSKPTTGQVKVMVGGKLYKTVPAADGKIVIPAADMKYTFLGNPDVRLIPVDEDGNEGGGVNPPPTGGGNGGGTGGGSSGAEMPFKANDLVMTTFQIIGLLSGFILIALAIQLTPRIIAVIKQSIKNRGMVK